MPLFTHPQGVPNLFKLVLSI